MPLDDTYPLAVTFITAPRRQEDGSVANSPIATGFVLNIPSSVPNLYFEYVVTAAHVVTPESDTSVRFRTKTGGTTDIRVAEWITHPAGADVAVTPLLAGRENLHLLHVPVSALMSAARDAPEVWRPDLGDRVYFVGLLELFKGMAERMVPMVRSGTVGALYQEDVPIPVEPGNPDSDIRYIEAHLIDCRSHGGFSGSPCFFQQDNVLRAVSVTGMTGPPGSFEDRGTQTLMLGLVSGHFDTWKAARVLGDLAYEPGSVEAPLNSGVGIVTPTDKILEVLSMKELSDERERITSEHQQRKPEVSATLDTATQDEYERFESLARKLVQVPKEEVDEKRKEEKRS